MGAYYMATINNTMYDTHSRGNGLKLMEHSYINNNYCNHIMNELKENPQPLVWLCDYHEPDEQCKFVWDDLEEDESETCNSEFTPIIINHSKGLYIDLAKLESDEDLIIHPIPLLCNSEKHSMGGGDYHPEDSRRGTWCLDDISTADTLPDHLSDFLDVTEDCRFTED